MTQELVLILSDTRTGFFPFVNIRGKRLIWNRKTASLSITSAVLLKALERSAALH